jgi:ribonuclease G
MSKELFISSSPHETKVAVLEDEQLVEVYYERDTGIGLVGSIYKGRVSRVLPGMQSAFVDIGLERDAFLYVSDFFEDSEEYEKVGTFAEPRIAQSGEPPAIVPPAPSEVQPTQETSSSPAVVTSETTVADNPSVPAGELPPSDTSAQHVPEPVSASAPTAPAAPAASAQSPGFAREEGRGGHDQRRGRRRRRGRGFGGGDRWASRHEQREHPAAPAPTAHEPVALAGIEPLPGESLAKYGASHESLPQSAANTDESQEDPATTFEATADPMVAAAESQSGQEADHAFAENEGAGKTTESFSAPVADKSVSSEPSPVTQAAGRGASIASASAASSAAHSSAEIADHELASSRAYYRAPLERETPKSTAIEAAGQTVTETEPPRFGLSRDTDKAAERVAAKSRDEVPEIELSAHPAPSVSSSPVSSPDETGAVTRTDQPPADKTVTAKLEPASGTEPESTPARHAEEPSDDETWSVTELRIEEFSTASGFEPQTEDSEEAAASETEEAETELEESEGDEEEAEGVAEDESAAQPAASTEPGQDGEATGDRSYTLRDQHRWPRFAPRRSRRRRGPGGPRTGHGQEPASRPGNNQPVQIAELLHEGQEILVQIAKEPIGAKGARITSHIALPGRYLVYMPTIHHIGVSRKIGSEEERLRLRNVILENRGALTGGFIVRTAGHGRSDEELKTDLRFLSALWADIKNKAERTRAPALLHRDLDLVQRVLRDTLSPDFKSIRLDNELEFERVLDFVNRAQPSLIGHVKLYNRESPMFDEFGIQAEIDKALKPKVWLKSGGFIVINQTEALVAIDVNTGKYVGKTNRLEDTIVKTNIDAVNEIVRQIRLRDLGGIIVIDFIDMDERRNRQKVVQALEEALRQDRAPTNILSINEFGLVALTRKRVKQSLERTLCEPCPHCTGSGWIKSVTTICHEILAEARKMAAQVEGKALTLRVHPEVARALKSREGVLLNELEALARKDVVIKSDPAVHQERFEIF